MGCQGGSLAKYHALGQSALPQMGETATPPCKVFWKDVWSVICCPRARLAHSAATGRGVMIDWAEKEFEPLDRGNVWVNR